MDLDVESAREISRSILVINKGLGEIDNIIKNMEEGANKEIWLYRLSSVYMVINDEIFRHIENQFPDVWNKEIYGK